MEKSSQKMVDFRLHLTPKTPEIPSAWKHQDVFLDGLDCRLAKNPGIRDRQTSQGPNIMTIFTFLHHQPIHMDATLTGWWLGHPSEKYESQLG